MRGFGGPQVFCALERLMDRIAVELAIDPVPLRLRNYVPAQAFPTRRPLVPCWTRATMSA